MCRPLQADPEVQRFMTWFVDLHKECGKRGMTDLLERASLSVIDLRQYPVLPMSPQECQCPCHGYPVSHGLHVCCVRCPSCSLNIKMGELEQHARECAEAPDTLRSLPSLDRDTPTS